VVAIRFAILPIADDRMADASEMDANLMLAAGQQIEFQ